MNTPSDHNVGKNRPARLPIGKRAGFFIAAAGLLVLGGAAGAMVNAQTHPTVSMAPAVPVAIHALNTTTSPNGIVTIRGQVAEIFGNKAIIADGSGRALVDLGRQGDERQIVTMGEPVTIQGRFERGFIHAAFLIGPDKQVQALGPLNRPPHGPHGPRGHGGPDGPGGPGGPRGCPALAQGPDGPVTPPAPGNGLAAIPSPAPAPTAH